jgi:hypothetical protein
VSHAPLPGALAVRVRLPIVGTRRSHPEIWTVVWKGEEPTFLIAVVGLAQAA